MSNMLSILYIIVCFLFFLFSFKKYNQKFNPISIFVVPWGLMVLCYNLKFVSYYDLSFYTYFILFMFMFLYCFGAFIGSSIHIDQRNEKTISIDEDILKLKLRAIIIISCVLGGISILSSIYFLYSKYGMNFIYKISQVYGLRQMGELNVNEIPYIGSFVFIAIYFGVFYYLDYGFHPVLLFPIILACLKPFTSGARQGLIQVIVIISLAFFLNKKERKRLTNSKKGKFIIVLTSCLLFSLLLFVSNQRSSYAVSNNFNNYATPQFNSVISKVPGIYHLYVYFSSPVGVLNKYLETESFSFGKNSLFPFYNLLNKFGFNINTERYQTFYSIPISSNVGTAVRELIEDYRLPFAMLLMVIFGFIVGKSYKKFSINNSYKNRFIINFLFFLVSMSWFMWFLRDANLIITLFVGYILSNNISKYEIVHKNNNVK